MKMLTIKDVYNSCMKQMLRGNGDKIILVAADEEGNRYNPLYCGIFVDEIETKALMDYGCISREHQPGDIALME